MTLKKSNFKPSKKRRKISGLSKDIQIFFKASNFENKN